MNQFGRYVKEWPYVVAITPYYQVNGRTGALVHYVDGNTEELDCRCEFAAEQLASNFHTTMEQARQKTLLMLGESDKRKPPLALHEGLCLIPLKCRDVNSRNHGTIGYVVLQYIKTVEYTPDGNSLIVFHKGAPPMEVLQRRKSVLRQIKLAKLAQEHYKNEKQHWENNKDKAFHRLTSDDWVPAVSDKEIEQIAKKRLPGAKKKSKAKNVPDNPVTQDNKKDDSL